MCPFEEKLFLYMDNELLKDEILEIEEHIKNCSSCKEEIVLLEKFEKDFHCEIPVPEDFTSKVMEKLDDSSSIFATIALAVLFIVFFFSSGFINPLPALGKLMVKLFWVLRDIPFLRLGGELLKQNMAFLSSYTILLIFITLFFLIWKKKKVFTGSLIF